MTVEKTGLLITGSLQDGSPYQWPRVPYARVISELDLICQGDAPNGADATFQLTLNGVGQTGTYPLPNGLITAENPVASLLIPANVFPGIKIIAGSGASFVAAWLAMTVTPAYSSNDPWVFVTTADLRTRISDGEWNAFTSDPLQLQSGDPVPEILLTNINRIRGAVARGGWQMGLEATIPRELLNECLTLAKYDLFYRVAACKGFAETVKPDADAVNALLENRVAMGATAVSAPVNFMVGKMQVGGQVETVQRGRLYFRRQQMDGLT